MMSARDVPGLEADLYEAGRFLLDLGNKATHQHHEKPSRWRSSCICGDRWPCREQAAQYDGIRRLQAVIDELRDRRINSRPLNGLERVALAVEKSRGTYARPTQPILFDCRPDAEDGA
jgi:hypothetical protein